MVVSEPMKKTIDYQYKETSYLDDIIYEIKNNLSLKDYDNMYQ